MNEDRRHSSGSTSARERARERTAARIQREEEEDAASREVYMQEAGVKYQKAEIKRIEQQAADLSEQSAFKKRQFRSSFKGFKRNASQGLQLFFKKSDPICRRLCR